jgi:hypothetical protein
MPDDAETVSPYVSSNELDAQPAPSRNAAMIPKPTSPRM